MLPILPFLAWIADGGGRGAASPDDGNPAELTHAASGHVWTVTSARLEEPKEGVTVVSMLHLSDGVQYRLVGASAEGYPGAAPARPSLEDGYVWLMKSVHESAEALAVNGPGDL